MDTNNIKQQALEALLNKMFSGRSFSVCDLDKAGDLIGVNPGACQHYKTLNALHCVNFADMNEELRQSLPLLVMECLRPTFRPNLMAKALLIEGNDHINTEDTFRLN